MLGLNGAAPEPEYPSLFSDFARAPDKTADRSLVQIESSTGRADRLSLTALQPRALAVEILKPGQAGETIERPLTFATANADLDSDAVTGSIVPGNPIANPDGDSNHGGEASLDVLCNALFTSAHDNDLPIPFFANLIWQESRLRDDAVSPKGALGIAQFMPKVAVESGLDDPFDPMQAIPASARLLRELRFQFGNLGFVAAAYNAGARRVAEWLEHRGSLPRETRGYVVQVTGLSVDAWRTKAVDNDALTFVRPLPCRSLPAFASIEQEHQEQARLQQAKLEQAKLEQAQTTAVASRRRSAGLNHPRVSIRRAAVRAARGQTGKHEAEHVRAQSKHKTV
jgi:hypothetical protein